jgi:hypothetical protein
MNFESADELRAGKKRDRTIPGSASDMVGRVTPCALPPELPMKRRAEDCPPYPPQPMRLPYNSESRTICA